MICENEWTRRDFHSDSIFEPVFEPEASALIGAVKALPLQGRRSSSLSYGPIDCELIQLSWIVVFWFC